MGLTLPSVLSVQLDHSVSLLLPDRVLVLRRSCCVVGAEYRSFIFIQGDKALLYFLLVFILDATEDEDEVRINTS